MKTLTCYLAGAIRDNHEEDIEWREKFSERMSGYIALGHLSILSPLAGKKLENGKWTSQGVPCDTEFVINTDFWAVDQADLIVFNMLSLSEGYHSIGTLTEWGRSTAKSTLRYVIAANGFTGHENLDQFKGIHPFIKAPATAVFGSVEACVDYLFWNLPVLLGIDPRYELRKEICPGTLANIADKGFFNA